MVQFFTENNDLLEVPDNASLTVISINPALDVESADRSFSYPMRCEWTDSNKVALGFSNRNDKPASVEIPIRMDIDNVTYEKGIGLIEEDSDADFQLNFQSNTRAILTELEKINIRDILDIIDIPQAIAPHWHFNIKDYNALQFAIVINDINYSVSNTPGTGFNKSTQLTALANSINAAFPNFAAYSSSSNRLVLNDPTYLYVGTIQIGALAGLEIHDHANYNQAQAANFYNYLANEFDTPAISHRFPVIRTIDFYPPDKKPSVWQGYLNYQKKISGSLVQGKNTAFESTKEFQYSYVPFVRVGYILQKIATKLGISGIQFDFQNGAELNDLLVINSTALDLVSTDYYTEFTTNAVTTTQKTENVFLKKIPLSNHVPDKTAKDFLMDIAGFELSFEFENNTLFFKKKNEPFALAITDLTDKIEPNWTRKRKTAQGYTIVYKQNKGETATVTGQLENYVQGEGKLTLELPFFTLPEVLNDSMKTPLSNQQKETDVTGFLFDRGIQTGNLGHEYYQAASGTTDYDGTENGSFSLNIKGAKGLFKQFFESIYELKEGHTYTTVMRFTAHELATLRRWRNLGKVYINFETGAVLCAIKNIQFKADTRTRGVTPCKVELIAYP